MKVLVTGANGFLGSWLVKRLLKEGYEVSALVRKRSDLSELSDINSQYSGLSVVYGDVTDKNSLLNHFVKKDIIFHLAGVVGYKKHLRPLMNLVNVQGTQNVVDACQLLAVPKLLHLSSVVSIGSSFKPEVMNEQSSYKISHLDLGYFETKRQAENIVLEAAAAGKIQATCVNPSTIYGFGDAKKGSRKNQIKVARGELKFYTAGGVNVVAVEDVVEGILLASQKGRNAERYILASENMTIKSLFEKIAAAAGVPAPAYQLPTWLLHALGFAGDQLSKVGFHKGLSQENAYTATMFHWFDSSKAQKELGFQPHSSDLAIENSVKWMKDHGYLADAGKRGYE